MTGVTYYFKMKRDHTDFETMFDTTKCAKECDRKVPQWDTHYEELCSKLAETPQFKIGFLPLTNNVQRVRFCLLYKPISDAINNYIRSCTRAEEDSCCGLGHRKIGTKAAEYRAAGNELYAKRKFVDAFVAFTRALVYAPQDGEEAPFAFGNRSACHFNLAQYENALDDIEAALSLGYDRYKPVVKLLLRKVECLLFLGRNAEARKLLEGPEKPADSESADGFRWAQLEKKLIKPALKPAVPRFNADQYKNFEYALEHTNCADNTKFKTHSQDKLMSLSNKVALRYDTIRGRHLVAVKPIEPADTITVSTPLVRSMSMKEERKLDRCHHCLTTCFPGQLWEDEHKASTKYPRISNPVPCDTCSNVLFCSKACRAQACETYHQFECAQLAMLYKLISLPFDVHFSLRMMYTAGSLDRIRTVVQECGANLDPTDLHDPVDYSFIYRLAFNPDGVGPDDLMKVAITASMLTKIAVMSGFAQDSVADKSLVGAILVRHLLQQRANSCLIIKQKGFESLEVTSLTILDPIRSLFNHSCETKKARVDTFFCDDYQYFQSTLMQATAIVPILPGEELTIGYSSMISFDQTTQMRQKIMYSNFGFYCACHVCSVDNPYGFGRYYPVACGKCGAEIRRMKSGKHFKCPDCAYKMTQEQVKSIYEKLDTIQSRIDSLIVQFETTNLKSNVRHGIQLASKMETVLAKEMAPLLCRNALPLARRYYKLCKMYAWLMGTCPRDQVAAIFSKTWHASEKNLNIVVALFGWDSNMVRIELQFVVSNFASFLECDVFVMLVLGGDQSMSRRFQEYKRRLAKFDTSNLTM